MRFLGRTTGSLGIGVSALLAMFSLAAVQDEGSTLTADFDSERLEGWELAGGASLRDGALQLDGPGHAFWFAAHGAAFQLDFRVRQGEGVGEVVLSASGEPPHHQQYALRLFGEEIELVRIDAGEERHLGAAPAGMAPGTWHRVEVRLSEGHLQVALNGRPLLSAVDERPLPPGGNAFGCIAGGGFAYDELRFRRWGEEARTDMAEERLERAEERAEERPEERPAPVSFAPVMDEAAASLTDDFEGGATPAWELEPGWSVERMREGGFALHGRGHSWARCVAGEWGDSSLSLRLRLVRGAIHLNYRVRETNRYFIGVHREGLVLHKQTGPQSFSGPLARADLPIPSDRFVTVQIRGEGGRLQVSVDESPVLDYRDSRPLTSGGIAFETLEESEAWVDSVRVRADRGRETAETPTSGQPAEAATRVQVAEPEGTGAQRGALLQVEPVPPAEMMRVALPAGPDRPPLALVARIPDRALGELQRAYVWERLGGPLGGLGYDVRMRPKTPGVMYVSDAWAGVFKSVDGGASWHQASDGIENRRGESRDAIPIFCLTIDPQKPDTIWVGALNERGIYRTDNAGKKWFRRETGIQETNGLTVRGFTVHPNDSNTVFMGAEITSPTWNKKLNNANQPLTGKSFDRTMGVLYKTTNGGGNWQAVRYFDNLVRYIWIDPEQPKNMYLSTGIFDREAKNTDAQKGNPGGAGVFKSVDGGSTWSPANKGLGNLYVGSLYMQSQDPKILLAGTGCNPWQQGAGVYLSTDGAMSWKQTLAGDVITAVEFAESDPKIAYAGSSSRIYRSADGGHTWKQRTPGNHWWGPPGVRAGWPIDFQVDPAHPNRLFANAYGGGNFLSVDGGATWSDASQGYTGAQIRDVAIAPGGGQRMWAAGRSGVFLSTDGGGTWRGMNYPPAIQLDWPTVEVDPRDPDHVLGASLWNALLFERQSPRGEWRMVHQLQSRGSQRVGFTDVVFAPSSENVVWAGTGGVASWGQLKLDLPGLGIYRSQDRGATWSPANDSVSASAHVQELLVHPDEEDRVWAATSTDGVLLTADAGGSWIRANLGLPESSRALSLAASRPWKNELYVGLDRAGLYRSTDGGEHWEPFMAGMNPNATVSAIVTDSRGAIYAADRSSGVYVFEQGSRMWRRINYRLHNREVNALTLTPDGAYLYAGTEGAGVYRVRIPP